MPNTITSIDKNRSLKLILLLGTIFIFIYYIISPFAFISPSSDLRWEVTINYLNKPSFDPGETVSLSGFAEEGESFFYRGYYYFFDYSEEVVWIVNVVGPHKEYIYFNCDSVLNAQGSFSIDLMSFNLPVNAASGIYTVKVFIWSDWLPDGLPRSTMANEITFEVV